MQDLSCVKCSCLFIMSKYALFGYFFVDDKADTMDN